VTVFRWHPVTGSGLSLSLEPSLGSGLSAPVSLSHPAACIGLVSGSHTTAGAPLPSLAGILPLSPALVSVSLSLSLEHGHCRRSNPLDIDSELQQLPETSIPGSDPAAGMQNLQNLAVMFRVQKFRVLDPLPLNRQAMDRSRRPRCSTRAASFSLDLFLTGRLGCVDGCSDSAVCKQAAGHRGNAS
jgi:hypothetical protein